MNVVLNNNCRRGIVDLSLTQLSISDVPPVDSFEKLIRFGSTTIGVPIAFVTVLDYEQSGQFFASDQGPSRPWTTQRQMSSTHLFCQHVVATEQPVSVSDARVDPLVQDNLALLDRNIIAYLGAPVSAPDGQIVGALCAIDDQPREWTPQNLSILTDLAVLVSDQIALRAALFESTQLRQIVDTIGQGFFIFDPKHFKFTYVNKDVRNNLGYSLRELQQLTLLEIKVGFSSEKFENMLSPLKKGEISRLEYEVILRRKDGSTFLASIRLEHLDALAGPTYLAFFEDITERQNLENSKKEEQNNLNALLQNASEPMAVFSIDGGLLQANIAYAQLLGCSVVDIIGTNFINLVPAVNRKEVLQNLSRTSFEKPSFSMRQRHDLNGRFRIMEWTNTTQFSDGVPTKFFSIASDVTQLHEVELQALASREKVAEFISIMSHEIRTPLNGILGNLELLKDTKLTDLQSNLIDGMEVSGRFLMSHVNDVLDISRYDSGKFVVHSKVFHLSQFLQDLVDNQSARAREQGTTLGWYWVGKPGEWVNADRNVIQAILLNLIGNAVKFTPQGSIMIEAQVLLLSKGKSEIEFRIKDTGIGIENAQCAKIFDDFWIGNASYNRSVGGTGLGLGIAKRFTELLGGGIGCKSTYGLGSKFWVRLPLEVITDQPVEVSPKNDQLDAKPQKILTVEDNAINRKVARGMLERLGHNVTEAKDGFEGIKLAEAESFDLILMDISMPVMDGRTAARAIRDGNGLSSNTPIIALTANVTATECATYLEDGMIDVLAKPLTLTALLQKLTILEV